MGSEGDGGKGEGREEGEGKLLREAVLELGLDVVMSWAPGYLLAKMAFLAWCMAPIHENGSNVIFNQVVLPLFHKHEAKIDTLASSAQAKAEKLLQQAVERSIEK